MVFGFGLRGIRGSQYMVRAASVDGTVHGVWCGLRGANMAFGSGSQYMVLGFGAGTWCLVRT